MKYIIFTAVLFLFAPVFAEDIEVTFNVNGPSCDHVLITTTGTPKITLAVYTEDQIRERMKREDDFILRQVKVYIRDTGFTNKAQVKALLENKNFDVSQKVIRSRRR